MQNFILSCDWGTSTFRLRLVGVRDHQIFGEILSDEGVSSTYNRWKASYDQHETSREHFYSMHLQKNIHALSHRANVDLTDIPVVISGMACSSIGMKELPYASLPFSLDGRNALVHRLSTSNGFSSDVWMISGVRNHYDVMRGEETQVIGLKAIDENAYTRENVTCIFPGTHSKHIQIVNGEIVDFKTYITGELFHVMTHHSILKDSVLEHRDQMLTDIDHDAFCHGVKQSGKSNLLQTLFSVRINQLFEHLTKEENFFYLSGLLIGTELRTLRNASNSIMLCSGSSVFHLYEFAIRELGLIDQTVFVAPDTMDKVAMEGQLKVFENYTA
jgi:2-dehydro-3-deoxygalactonokinase